MCIFAELASACIGIKLRCQSSLTERLSDYFRIARYLLEIRSSPYFFGPLSSKEEYCAVLKAHPAISCAA
jgi:hypothetical protein